MATEEAGMLSRPSIQESGIGEFQFLSSFGWFRRG